MNETMKPFLNEGLRFYAQARATMTFFEAEISKLLLNAVEQREEWPFLESHKVIQPKPDKGAGQVAIG